MKRRSSIASRLITAVLLVEIASAVLVILLAWGYERHTHFRSFDVMLRGRADSVLGAVQDAEDVGDNVMLDLADLHVPSEDVYEVWDGRGHLLGRSSNWLGSAQIHSPGANGFFHSEIGPHRYRLLRLAGTRIVDPGEKGGGHLRFVTILYGSPTDHVWRSIYGAVEFYAIGMLVLVLTTGPLIAWVLHRGLAPLRELADLAARVSADSWSFDPPASARETSELAPLTHTLETVLQRLERSFKQQRTFISDAAHELKTAVAVVKSSLQLTGMKPRTSEEYQAGNQRALADTERIEELVAKMLILARFENTATASQPPLAPSSAELNQCIARTLSDLETAAAVRQVSLVLCTMPTGPCTVPLTPDDCSLVLSNLLLNAIQHSPPQTQVEIHLAIQGNFAQLTIRDFGEGIDPADLPHVFERFYRADPSRARTTGGTGLGLAICKAAIEKAGGTITLSSNPGKGTTAAICLPCSDDSSRN
ncbi:sensor histidine kinase [Occallatibacter savannae]|uniref:sensor histidine kinase n=1 Tax=Occallatibacter savannae TaxID=1002691 RepID=UPI000D69C615|nr:ATP-binding protein [Occallatibacter savannae]